MRGLSGLGRLIREYVEDRDGKLNWLPNLYLFLDNTGRAKQCMRGTVPCNTYSTPDGREYSLFRIRGVHCPHPDKWFGRYVRIEREGIRSYFSVPAKECKMCEFHEPAKKFGKRRYARCGWFRKNNDMKEPGKILQESVVAAKEMLGA